MSKIIHTIYLTIILCVSAGCAYTYNISHLEPYAQYVGQEVELIRPVYLDESLFDASQKLLEIYITPEGERSDDYIFLRRRFSDDRVLKKAAYGNDMYLTPAAKVPVDHKKYWMQRDEGHRKAVGRVSFGRNAHATYVNRTWSLPVGTKLWIDQVKVSGGGDSGPHIEATGRVELPETHETVIFSYLWGSYSNLGRAPWENSDTPETRHVGFKGNKYQGSLSR